MPTPGLADRQQTPFALTDTSNYSQHGASDVSANTHVSDGSWQPRPSLQGVILQVTAMHTNNTCACSLIQSHRWRQFAHSSSLNKSACIQTTFWLYVRDSIPRVVCYHAPQNAASVIAIVSSQIVLSVSATCALVCFAKQKVPNHLGQHRLFGEDPSTKACSAY